MMRRPPSSTLFPYTTLCRSCAGISGATSSTYVLSGGEVGLTVVVVVTATNGAGSASATSAETAVVTAAPVAPTNTSPPTISGNPQQGQTMTANGWSWSGTAS